MRESYFKTVNFQNTLWFYHAQWRNDVQRRSAGFLSRNEPLPEINAFLKLLMSISVIFFLNMLLQKPTSKRNHLKKL